eukprot:TRINITY_DN11730_c0_g1_i1.p1 TRINITY_DN11730_c0_g1~~TRINITY_DN11730_c0_g1_i1.p1  ORF type:complete len:306 (-),score=48.44 TRINITY_DN11730_c0_g1_i1:32-949(-)
MNYKQKMLLMVLIFASVGNAQTSFQCHTKMGQNLDFNLLSDSCMLTDNRCDTDYQFRDAFHSKKLTTTIGIMVMCENGDCYVESDTLKKLSEHVKIAYAKYGIDIRVDFLKYINNTGGPSTSFGIYQKYAINPESVVNIFYSHKKIDYCTAFAMVPWSGMHFIWLNTNCLWAWNFNSLVHELGHIFGLAHSMSKSYIEGGTCEQCDEPVHDLDDQSFNYRGDWVADTPANPVRSIERNFTDDCNAVEAGLEYDCDGALIDLENGGAENFMTYNVMGCLNHFTPQQVSRMKCWGCQEEMAGHVSCV